MEITPNQATVLLAELSNSLAVREFDESTEITARMLSSQIGRTIDTARRKLDRLVAEGELVRRDARFGNAIVKAYRSASTPTANPLDSERDAPPLCHHHQGLDTDEERIDRSDRVDAVSP